MKNWCDISNVNAREDLYNWSIVEGGQHTTQTFFPYQKKIAHAD